MSRNFQQHPECWPDAGPFPIYRVDITPVEVDFENLPVVEQLRESLRRFEQARFAATVEGAAEGARAGSSGLPAAPEGEK